MTTTAAYEQDVKSLLELFTQVHTIRAFEEQAIDLFAKGLITGSTHPCIGQEAIAVGVCSVLQKDDPVLATYRGHGVAIAKGCDPGRVMAELLTRTTGYCQGRGGSMHLCDPRNGFLGTNAIVAAHIPIAGGVALANKLRRNNLVTVCFFGDGAACEGEFFETLNMAGLWQLPLVLVCENNGFAISVPTQLSQSTPDIADRARGFGIPSAIVDGNDLLAVRAEASAAIARARGGAGPRLLECKTTRWERHSAFSAGRYENPEQAQMWRKVDPIPRFRKWMLEMGVDDALLDKSASEAQSRIEKAVEFALASPEPSPDSVFEGIFA